MPADDFTASTPSESLSASPASPLEVQTSPQDSSQILTPPEPSEAESRDIRPPAPVTALPQHERKRILIVESDGEVSDELARLMEELGHVVQIAADAKTALFELHDFNPHLVLLGTYLADMPGYELSSILHGAPQYSYKFRHVGLLFVADRRKLLKHRFVGAPEVPIARYIFKPLNPVEVRDKVGRTLREGVM